MSPAGTGSAGRGGPVALDLLELWVGDLARIRHLLSAAFGFQPCEVALPGGPEERVVGLVNGDARVVLRQGGSAADPVARHVARHGDTVADVALVCAEPEAVAARARAYGLRVRERAGTVVLDLLGDGTICHSLRATSLLPGPCPSGAGPVICGIDHVAYCLPWGWAEPTARAYEAVLGLERVDVGDAHEVGDQVAGMRSVVLRSRGGFTVVLTEPASPASTGQTQRFVDAHAGPGVQHAAFAYDDLLGAAELLRTRGVAFLPIPEDYYPRARRRLADRPIPWEALRRLGVLADADERGLLYQLFTVPLTARKTFFAELIQRAGAEGFGANNVRALFAAVHAALGDGRDRAFVQEVPR